MSQLKTYIISLLIIIGSLLYSFDYNAQIYKLDLDSLWNIVRSDNQEDTLKVQALSKIASQYFNTFPDSTVFFLNQSINLSKSIGYIKGEARGHMNLGAIASIQGNTSLAAEHTMKALERIEQTDDSVFNIQILTNLAALMQSIGEDDKGLEYASQAYELARLSDNITPQINTLSTVASFKASKGECEEAIKDYKLCLRTAEEHNIFGSEYYYTVAGLASCYEEIYHNYDSTIVWYDKMNAARELLNSSNIDISYYKEKAQNALKYGKIEEAEALADSTLVYALKIQAKNSIADYYFLKADIDEEKGFFKSAYSNYKKAKAYQDTLKDEKKEKTLLDLEMKYNSEKKGKELLLRNAELEKNDIEIESQKNQKWIMMIIFGLGTIFTWFVIFSFLKNRKKNTLLKAQNEELEKLSIVAKEIDSTVIITGKTGVIEWINEGIIEMYGLSKLDITKRIGTKITETSNYQSLQAVINECVFTKKSCFYTSKHHKESGSILWVQTTLTPILDQNGEVNKIVFIDTNVSAVKKSEIKLSVQKHLLETKNNQITDSFNYAKRIQQAVLPSDQTLSSVWQEHFALLNPKDIVSGDFYWFYEKNNKKYLAVVDCTGHGVPGAFMTIIGNNLLNEILQDNFNTPVEILQELHIRIKIRLGGSIKAKVMDSMDLGLICFDTNTKEILFTGTHTSVYLIRGRSLSEFKGSKETIGFKNQIKLKMHSFQAKSGDMIYMHTDGYPDQKGGHRNKKFYYQPIRDMLINISQENVTKQKEVIDATFQDWKGMTEQTDDVCMVGVRIV